MHSQSQTIQEPLSAELTPVRLHPTVQLPVGERKRQVAAAVAGQKAGPPLPGGLAAMPAAGEQEEGRWRAGELQMGADGDISLDPREPEAPFPMEGCQGSIYSRSCPRARRIGHFLLLHPLARRPRRKIRFNCGERKEEAPGQLDRHNPHELAQTTRGGRGASAYFTRSMALTVLRCAYTQLPQETADPGGLPRTCSLS